MTSLEIQKKINELEKQKEALNNELAAALKKEKKEKEQKILSGTKDTILKLYDIYWKNEDNADIINRLNNVNDQGIMVMWLESDVEYILTKNKLANIDELKELTKNIPDFDIYKCIDAAAVRTDFEAAFKAVNKGSELSRILRYGFSDEDLTELMKLYKSNKCRRKIEELLTDCNFHSECGLLMDKKYDEYMKSINE